MPFTARSQPARDAIVGAARRAFAAHGIDAATVRAIAADAGVDPSMVIRYFGSKDGLVDAATEVDLGLPELHTTRPAERGAALAHRFVALWDDPVTGEVLTLLLRSAPTDQRAAARIREVFSSQVASMIADLDPDDRDARARRAGVVSSYVLGTALARYVLLLPPLADASPDQVVAMMTPVLQGILDDDGA